MSLCWRLPAGGPADLEQRCFRAFPPEQAQLFEGLVVWDSWPLVRRDNSLYVGPSGEQHWFALAAPRRDDPDLRHGEARIHHLIRSPAGFEMVGPLFASGHTPGSREWSGSAVIDGGTVTLNFTAAGRLGDAEPSAEQRLFAAAAELRDGFGPWGGCEELLVADGRTYRIVGPGPAIPGKVKGFRDPEPFRDKESADWLLFTGSNATAADEHDGVIGLARLGAGGYRPAQPLIDGSGTTRELERPHIRMFDHRLYLFWSVQAEVFSGSCAGWPTGLYGATAASMEGPWSLLNGDGLVAANPPSQPRQAYSWLVLPGGEITSFADHAVVNGRDSFLGGFAPFSRLSVDGDRAWVSDAG